MLVDLTTKSRILEDLILTDYQGIILEEQVRKTGEDKNKLYHFLKLNYEELMDFLNDISNKNYQFIISDNETKIPFESNHNFNKPTYHH